MCIDKECSCHFCKGILCGGSECAICAQTPYCLKCYRNTKKEETSLIMGNGIILSHPEHACEFKFNYRKIESHLIEVYKKHYQKANPECPEKLLNIIRLELSFEILKYYIKKLRKTDFKIDKIKNFIKYYRNIFNLNYDPILYKSIFSNPSGKESNFKDGFKGEDKIPADEIEKRIKEDNKKSNLYYLHGAFHILYVYDSKKKQGNSAHYYKKIKSGGDILTDIENKYEEIINSFRENPDLIKPDQSYEDILYVIESKSRNKKAWIERDPYLDFCYSELGKQKNILTLGCSFANDEHILEKILLNKNLEHLTIGLYQNSDKKNVCKAIRKIKESHLVTKNKTEENNKKYQNKTVGKKSELKETLAENINKIRFVCTKNLSEILWD